MTPAEQLVPGDVIRREADRVVDEFPNDALEILAADLVGAPYEQEGIDIAVAIAAELLRRSAAGVRKWPATAEEIAADEFEHKLTGEMNRILSGAELTDADLIARAYKEN